MGSNGIIIPQISKWVFFALLAGGLAVGGGLAGCSSTPKKEEDKEDKKVVQVTPQVKKQMRRSNPARGSVATPERLSYAALDRTRHRVIYNGAYMPIGYPNGDVPANMGVCTDTVIRSYRRLGIDLQRLVHEDMMRNFYSYPNLPKWGLNAPDSNIDHRRVHNLKAFFARHGARLPVTGNSRDYRPGDLVTWYLGGDQEHIGIVVDRRSKSDPNRFMVVHNIGEGEKLEDVLFKMPISGHYRYFPQWNGNARLAYAR